MGAMILSACINCQCSSAFFARKRNGTLIANIVVSYNL